jgi:hypothetical protein
MGDDTKSRAVNLQALVADDATTGSAANLDVIEALPLVLHAAGEHAEVLDEAVNLVVGPLTDTTQGEAIGCGRGVSAEAVGIDLVALGATLPTALRVLEFPEVETAVSHGGGARGS